MTAQRFIKNLGPKNLSEIAKYINCQIPASVEDIKIFDICSLDRASKEDITFLSNKKYTKSVKDSKAAACIVPKGFNEDVDLILLKVDNPYYEYARLLDLFYGYQKNYSPKIAKTAHISSTAKIGENCYIGHNVVIEDNVEIGNNSIIEAGTFIDYGVKIGKNARIDSNVSISYSVIGDDVVILPGAKIGQDGFGFATQVGVHKKIYHTGLVIVGNDVEIGANTTIDRGSMNNTVIEDLVRIDNLVQLGHNVHIKKGAIIVSQAGVAGSSTIGSYSALGGQVGIAGHLNIADFVQIAGQGGAIQNIEKAGIYGGTPAVPIRDWHKQSIFLKKSIRDRKK